MLSIQSLQELWKTSGTNISSSFGLFSFSFEVDGREMSMVEFFAKKKNVRINGKFPAVRQQKDREVKGVEILHNLIEIKALFPMSCVIILPGQRVTIDKMSEAISRELLNVMPKMLGKMNSYPL